MDTKRMDHLWDKQARTLVGKLCKRIEVLEHHNALTPDLYKDLIKELVYEQFRDIKHVLKMQEEASVSFSNKRD